MALDPWQKRLQAIFLCSPEKSSPVFGVVAMEFAAMLEESAVVKEAFTADPAHYRRRRDCKRQVIDRLFSTAL